MGYPKQIKDMVARLLQEPTLDHLREYLRGHTGEHDTIDFKGQWIEKQKLAKEMISIANMGGGIIFFGIHENEDKTFSYDGIEEIKDKARISDEIKNLISTDLKYDIYDFVYDSSEYDKLAHHNYQMLEIEDNPKFLPFMAKKDSGDLKGNRIYIRRGTSIEEANQEEIAKLISSRINAEYPDSGKTLNLNEHLEQLKILYNKINSMISYYKGGISDYLASVMIGVSNNSIIGQRVSEKNPLYPDENYEDFILRMIEAKKKKIERELDLK